MTTSRSTSGVALPVEVADTIWADTIQESAVMSVAQRIVLPGNGVSVPMITSEPEAAFVNEGSEKPVDDGALAKKVITPYKIAVIQAFTDEFRRDADALYAELAKRLPGALAAKFDSAVFHGPVPGSGFDTLEAADALTLDSTGTYTDLAAIDAKIAIANGVNSAWVLSPKGRGVVRSAVDGEQRPLFVNDSELLGAPVRLSRGVYKADAAGDDGEILGFAGDWTNAFYGTVNGIEVSMSDQATLNIGGTQTNLWQRNMFAIRAEVEVGFAVRDIAKFVKIVGSNAIA